MIANPATRPAVFGLKVGLPTQSGSVEHIWVRDVEKLSETRLRGKLNNAPADLGDLREGSEVSFDRDQVSDWYFNQGGRGYGHFTTRVILERIDPEQAAQIRSVLSRDPLPAGWRS